MNSSKKYIQTPNLQYFDNNDQNVDCQFTQYEQSQMIQIWKKLNSNRNKKQKKQETNNINSGKNIVCTNSQINSMIPQQISQSKEEILDNNQFKITSQKNQNIKSNENIQSRQFSSLVIDTPHAIKQQQTQYRPLNSLNKKLEHSSLLANNYEQIDELKQRIDVLGSDNVKLYMNNKKLSQNLHQCNQHNMVLIQENNNLKREIQMISKELYYTKTNTVSKQIFNNEINKMSQLLLHEKQISREYVNQYTKITTELRNIRIQRQKQKKQHHILLNQINQLKKQQQFIKSQQKTTLVKHTNNQSFNLNNSNTNNQLVQSSSQDVITLKQKIKKLEERNRSIFNSKLILQQKINKLNFELNNKQKKIVELISEIHHMKTSPSKLTQQPHDE